MASKLKLEGVERSGAERLRGGCSKTEETAWTSVMMVLQIQALNLYSVPDI